ncbi:hypothetical protein [Jannaschia formosa]|uniref:hypothetical protein n=1 Tax=Jannaschia formosa TaxID=2259592 RepID=UPI000E1B61E0|nr:hypothetical protein [Jannaschia formosa]TFL16432.1 hypothetical protein DR046_20135 [Jannaschia formosa]
MRDRRWIEFEDLSAQARVQIDANAIKDEPEEDRARHTPPLDRSGDLWMPGSPSRVKAAGGVSVSVSPDKPKLSDGGLTFAGMKWAPIRGVGLAARDAAD